MYVLFLETMYVSNVVWLILVYIHSHRTITTIRIRNISITSKSVLMPFGNNPFSCLSQYFLSQGNNYSFYLYNFHFLGFYLNRIRQYVVFCESFFTQLIILRFIFTVAFISSASPILVCCCMVVPQLIDPFMCRTF